MTLTGCRHVIIFKLYIIKKIQSTKCKQLEKQTNKLNNKALKSSQQKITITTKTQTCFKYSRMKGLSQCCRFPGSCVHPHQPWTPCTPPPYLYEHHVTKATSPTHLVSIPSDYWGGRIR